MKEYGNISVQQAQGKLAGGNVQLIDIRDDTSFKKSHVIGAINLPGACLNSYIEIEQQDPTIPVLVMCYHGISSKVAAHYLLSHGFDEVHSVEGGFAAWSTHFPQLTEGEPF